MESGILCRSVSSTKDTKTFAHRQLDERGEKEDRRGSSEGLVSQQEHLSSVNRTGSNIDCFTDARNTNFVARPSKEPVRNCSLLDRDIKAYIVDIVASALLNSAEAEPSRGLNVDSDLSRGSDSIRKWRNGGNCIKY